MVAREAGYRVIFGDRVSPDNRVTPGDTFSGSRADVGGVMIEIDGNHVTDGEVQAEADEAEVGGRERGSAVQQTTAFGGRGDRALWPIAALAQRCWRL